MNTGDTSTNQKSIGSTTVRPPDSLLSVKDVAMLLQVGEQAVRLLIDRKQLPAIHIGKKYLRIRPQAISEFLDRMEQREGGV